MKHMRKVFALALTLIMALALTVPAFAANVTIDSPNNANATYKAYKLMNLTTALTCTQEEVEGGHEHDKNCYAYSYTINEGFEGALKAATGVTAAAQGKTLDQTITEALATYNTAEKARELAEKLYAQVKDMTIATTLTAGQAADLGQGYWLIVDTSTLGNGEVNSLVMLDTAGQKNITITAKDDSIGIEKKVNGVEYVTAYIGETVTYTLKSNLPTNLEEYASGYTFKFVDTMDDGLDFQGITSVTIGGTTVTTYTTSGFFAADASSKNGEGVIDLSTYVDANKATLGGKEVIVTYTAKVNSNADVSAIAENNDVKVVYSSDYHTTTTTGETVVDDADVYTYHVDIVKFTDSNTDTKGYDAADTRLANAKFQLYKVVDGKTFYAVASGSASPYTMTAWAEATEVDGAVSVPANATTFVSNANGDIVINGLAAGEYKLVETEAPNGYNLLADPVTVTVTVTENNNAVTMSSDTVYVENSTGSILPSTGGIGTTIFYVVGGLLMAGAIILLITKKKLSNEQ